MYRSLQEAAVDFTMGPSYMEDDIRMETNRTGFCDRHIRLLYQNQNRLGLALILLTHTEQVIRLSSDRNSSQLLPDSWDGAISYRRA